MQNKSSQIKPYITHISVISSLSSIFLYPYQCILTNFKILRKSLRSMARPWLSSYAEGSLELRLLTRLNRDRLARAYQVSLNSRVSRPWPQAGLTHYYCCVPLVKLSCQTTKVIIIYGVQQVQCPQSQHMSQLIGPSDSGNYLASLISGSGTADRVKSPICGRGTPVLHSSSPLHRSIPSFHSSEFTFPHTSLDKMQSVAIASELAPVELLMTNCCQRSDC